MFHLGRLSRSGVEVLNKPGLVIASLIVNSKPLKAPQHHFTLCSLRSSPLQIAMAETYDITSISDNPLEVSLFDVDFLSTVSETWLPENYSTQGTAEFATESPANSLSSGINEFGDNVAETHKSASSSQICEIDETPCLASTETEAFDSNTELISNSNEANDHIINLSDPFSSTALDAALEYINKPKRYPISAFYG